MSLASLAEKIGCRARDAASRGEDTFGVPEMSGVIDWVAATTADPGIRAEASTWLSSGAGYHALVRLCTRAVIGLDSLSTAVKGRYRSKVEGELEPMLRLWPDVILLPTTSRFARVDLIELRAFPVHPLGLVDRPIWTDGEIGSPSEFFFHDLDHARFKVREDLLVEGVEIPDAYQHGSTLDPTTGRHRVIMTDAVGRMTGQLWARVALRGALARHLRRELETFGDGHLRSAAELLLFEIVHEKSFSLEPSILRREAAVNAHVSKLRMKARQGFFPRGADLTVVAALPAAQVALREMLA